MPSGKYKGRQLLDLPEPYLVWFHSKGFPQGKLAVDSGRELMALAGVGSPILSILAKLLVSIFFDTAANETPAD